MNNRELAELENRFEYHKPDADKVLAHEKARGFCYALAQLIVELVPPGREQSLAITKLEECLFWMNAGIARN